MISRAYLLIILLMGVIIGCTYTQQEIPPPACYSIDTNKPAALTPVEPIIDLNIVTPQFIQTEETQVDAQDQTPAPEPAPVPEPDATPLEKNELHGIDFEMNNRIQWWMKRFTGPDKKYFRVTLADFDTLRPSMEKIFQTYGIPRDLVYICMIESGGRPNAVSPAGATGYWQFTADTARSYKLTVNSWVDERRDLVKSTHAAARYLKNLYSLFNDWLLAGAAYNAGEGSIYRLMRDNPQIDTYWDIDHRMPIKHETLDYIPKLIATIVLAKNRAYYGLDESDDSKYGTLSFETVRVPPFTYLNDIADLLGVPNKQIALLNADLVRQCTPPSGNGHEIKVPRGTADTVAKNIEKIRIEKPRERFADGSSKDKAGTHTVKKGDTLTGIARKYSLSVEAIARENGLKKDDTITIGRVLAIPGAGKAEKPTESEKHIHVVAKGETLKGISRRYGVSADEIAAANDIKDPNRIRPDMVLNIPPKPLESTPRRQMQYTVKKGDTIWSISRHFDVSADDVMKWNKLAPTAEIHPGDEITIRKR